MSRTTPGRHRAPRKPLLTRAGQLIEASSPLGRSSAVAAAAGGLVLTMSSGAQAAPAPATALAMVAATPAFTPVTVTPATTFLPATPLPANPLGTSTVRLGSRGEAVRSVQRIVGVSADGIFGPNTLAAVKRYQASKGLVADGVVGPRTRNAMSGGAASTTAATSTSSSVGSIGSTTVRLGSRGEAVRVVQRVVGVSADGIFGSKTQTAVKRYQASRGLTADGIVGPRTRIAMGIGGGAPAAASRETTTTSRSATRTAPAAAASGVIGIAAQYTGIMYRYGGTSPSTGFDCSGYTQFVFGRAGHSLPRTTEAQRRATTRVSASEAKPGDLIFFGSPAYHVGIYAGDGMMYDSGRSGLPTQKRKVFSSGTKTYGRVG